MAVVERDSRYQFTSTAPGDRSMRQRLSSERVSRARAALRMAGCPPNPDRALAYDRCRLEHRLREDEACPAIANRHRAGPLPEIGFPYRHHDRQRRRCARVSPRAPDGEGAG